MRVEFYKTKNSSCYYRNYSHLSGVCCRDGCTYNYERYRLANFCDSLSKLHCNNCILSKFEEPGSFYPNKNTITKIINVGKVLILDGETNDNT